MTPFLCTMVFGIGGAPSSWPNFSLSRVSLQSGSRQARRRRHPALRQDHSGDADALRGGQPLQFDRRGKGQVRADGSAGRQRLHARRSRRSRSGFATAFWRGMRARHLRLFPGVHGAGRRNGARAKASSRWAASKTMPPASSSATSRRCPGPKSTGWNCCAIPARTPASSSCFTPTRTPHRRAAGRRCPAPRRPRRATNTAWCIGSGRFSIPKSSQEIAGRHGSAKAGDRRRPSPLRNGPRLSQRMPRRKPAARSRCRPTKRR